MTDRRNTKAWPRVVGSGKGLFDALVSIVELVDDGAGRFGGHLRDLYATGLEEAAPILERPGLHEAAEAWRRCADLWEELADAAAPDDLDDAADAVGAAEEVHEEVMRGEPGRTRARAAAGRLWAARARYADAIPLSETRIASLFEDLGSRLAAIHAAERAALAATARAIGR